MTHLAGFAIADVPAERGEQCITGAGNPEIVEERGAGSGDQPHL
jgi:hypothetical protein